MNFFLFLSFLLNFSIQTEIILLLYYQVIFYRWVSENVFQYLILFKQINEKIFFKIITYEVIFLAVYFLYVWSDQWYERPEMILKNSSVKRVLVAWDSKDLMFAWNRNLLKWNDKCF